MQNKLWEAVYEVFREVGGDRTMQVEAEALIALRKRLRSRLDTLRAALSEQLTEREIYYILFPIVVYLDEIVQAKMLPGERVEWIRLQKELYDIDTGGAVFYEVLEDLLRKPDTYPFIYEVFFFCLSDGYLGRYKGNMVKLNEYKDRLRKRIQVQAISEYAEPQPTLPPIVIASFPWWYYLTALILIVATWFGLNAAATLEKPLPDQLPGPIPAKSFSAHRARRFREEQRALEQAAREAQRRREEIEAERKTREAEERERAEAVRRAAKFGQSTTDTPKDPPQEPDRSDQPPPKTPEKPGIPPVDSPETPK